MSLLFRASTISALLAGLALPSMAGVLTFSDRSVWTAAVGPHLVLTNFEGIAPAGGLNSYDLNGYTDALGVTYVGSKEVNGFRETDLFVISDSAGGFGGWGSDYLWGGYTDSSTLGMLEVTLPSLHRAFGADLFNYVEGGVLNDVAVVTNLNPDGYNFFATTPAKPGKSFVGFATDNTSEFITGLRFTSNADGNPSATLLDNVTMEEVPEPSSWLLFASGLGTVAMMRRNRA